MAPFDVLYQALVDGRSGVDAALQQLQNELETIVAKINAARGARQFADDMIAEADKLNLGEADAPSDS